MSDPDRLVKAVVELLDTLDDASRIERCTHRGCDALSAGLPDYGPSVGDSVCANHVPTDARLIASHEDMTDALRSVYDALAPYGYHYDRMTGRLLTVDDDTDPVHLAEGI